LDNKINNNIDLKLFLERYLQQWKWFVLAVSICLVGAFLYLRYTTPLYKASSTILIKDDKNGGMMSELSAFSDIGLGAKMKSSFDNELQILQSRTLVASTVKKLNLNTRLIIDGEISEREIYDDSPFTVNFVDKTNQFYESSIDLKFTEISPTKFELLDQTQNESQNVILGTAKSFEYEKPIMTKYGTLVISKKVATIQSQLTDDKSIIILVRPLKNVAASFKNRLRVDLVSNASSVVTLSINDPIIKKAEDFLNNLTQTYNEEAAADKYLISGNTSIFIGERLKLITRELDGVEQDVQSFKKSNNLINIESEAELFIQGSSEYDKKGLETEIQLDMVSSMLDFIKKSNNSDFLPANIVSGDNSTAALISSYNQFVLDRNRLLKSATLSNPSVIKMDQQILSLRNNVQTSLLRTQSNLNIQRRESEKKESKLNDKIGKIPLQERQLRVIARQQQVKEQLYLYLLQKREEAAISLAATEPNARVIDFAEADMTAVSPKKKIIYLASLLLGLLVPFGIIYTNDLLDTKIKTQLDLDGKTLIPFLGDLPTSTTAREIIKPESRSSAAEALRIIRTNLDFMLNKVPEHVAKTIFTTSTVAKEGKTFVAANLAATFALSAKKVLLIGMDIRSPRLGDYFKLPEPGFSNYLSSNDIKLEDLIVKVAGYEHFYVLPPGVIPPNPAELLMSKKVDSLFETLKKEYDYIIVDTAPVSLVADTLLIAHHADTVIYVARANFSEKEMLNLANSLHKNNKLPNMCILLNDTVMTKRYGYGYGRAS
jgi:tyrosine-protein kinase Etk/Wzc